MKLPRRGTILVAEDDRTIGNFVCEVLSSEGYTVERVLDGASAVLAVRAKQPQLLLLDIGLPVMTGDEVLKALRCAGFWNLAIVVTSAASNSTTYLGLGANAVLPKPFLLEELIAVVNQYTA